MPERSKVETLLDSVRDLVTMDVAAAVVANHVSLVLQGWAKGAGASPRDRVEFEKTCTLVARCLEDERVAMLANAAGQTHGRPQVVLARAETLEAARAAAIAAM